jgi:hypothetical protein
MYLAPLFIGELTADRPVRGPGFFMLHASADLPILGASTRNIAIGHSSTNQRTVGIPIDFAMFFLAKE